MSSRARGVVVAHADLAEALVRTIERISGEQDALTAVSNDGLSTDALARRLEEVVGDGPAVIFVDLGGGSCGHAGRGLARTHAAVGVLTGVNVPTLLDFVFHRDLPIGELLARLVAKGREQLGAFGPGGAPPAAG